MINDIVISIIVVSSDENFRLHQTLKSLENAPSAAQIVVVTPSGDSKSKIIIDLFAEIYGGNFVHVHDTGEGVYFAMNVGVQNATGKYVMFLNAGDVIFSMQEFERLIIQISSINTPWIITNPILDLPLPHVSNERDLYSYMKLEGRLHLSHQSVIFEASHLRLHHLFDTKFRIASDFKQMFQYYACSRAIFLNLQAFKVEKPKLSATYHRRSRFETFLVLLTTAPRNNCRRILNLSGQEMIFALRKFGRVIR